MNYTEQLRSTTRLLEKLADNPEVADGVAEAVVHSDLTETAIRVTEEKIIGHDRLVTRTFPQKIYEKKCVNEVDYERRFEEDRRPTRFEESRFDAIEKALSPVDCGKCSGRGWNTCHECDGGRRLPCRSGCGDGRTTCEACEGEAQVVCGRCRGQGTHNCTDCRGAGKHSCSCSDGKINCPECSGFWGGASGYQTCPKCSGNKEVKEWGDEEPRPCPRCSGAGRISCPNCHGHTEVPCTDCGQVGYHPCSTCGRAGTVLCKLCDSSGSVECSDCDNGTRACDGCDGESTIPCGCGDGRTRCSLCAGGGRLVRAKTATVSYRSETKQEVESELGVTGDMFTPQVIVNSDLDRPISDSKPVEGGRWTERHHITHEQVPVRKVEYEFDGTTYEVLDVGGEIYADSTPDSAQFAEAKSVVKRQAEQLRDEYDTRVAHVEGVVAGRREELQHEWERRQSVQKVLRVGAAVVGLLALAGIYLSLFQPV